MKGAGLAEVLAPSALVVPAEANESDKRPSLTATLLRYGGSALASRASIRCVT
jgi:hypothetical protein